MERHTSVEVAARQTETMDGMIVAKLKQLIVERRTDLWWYLPTYLPTYLPRPILLHNHFRIFHVILGSKLCTFTGTIIIRRRPHRRSRSIWQVRISISMPTFF